MTSGIRTVFVHGQGFNCYAEQAILGPVFAARGHEITFWNEPSRLRPAGDAFEPANAWERWLTSAEHFTLRSAESSPVHLIAHSLAVQAAVEIARRHPERVASLVLVGPAADPLATFRNVMRVAREDLAVTRPDVAEAIAACIARTRAFFDDAMREGLMHVLHDERLFTHYWADPGQMQASLAARARPEGQFDVESFFAVLEDFARRGPEQFSSAPVTAPTLALFGSNDRITPLDEQRAALEATIPSVRVEQFTAASHYLHLDQPVRFAGMVADWASGPSSKQPESSTREGVVGAPPIDFDHAPHLNDARGPFPWAE